MMHSVSGSITTLEAIRANNISDFIDSFKESRETRGWQMARDGRCRCLWRRVQEVGLDSDW